MFADVHPHITPAHHARTSHPHITPVHHATHVQVCGGVHLHARGVHQQADDVLLAAVGGHVQRREARLGAQLADEGRGGRRRRLRLERGRHVLQQLTHDVCQRERGGGGAVLVLLGCIVQCQLKCRTVRQSVCL